MKKILLGFIIFILSAYTAEATQTPVAFKIVPEQSYIKFEATQAGAPIRGEFKSFNADIKFSPEALDKSTANVTIDMGSFTVDDSEAKGALKDATWFNVPMFPQAKFETTSFKSLGGKRFEATANLTIKGQVRPVNLVFILNEFSTSKAAITGELTLKRRDFDIGDKNTDSIKDEVKVSVEIKAIAIK